MWIQIEDLRPLGGNHAGQLWILASYYDRPGGRLLSREQCHCYPVFAEVVARLTAKGEMLCLDGRVIKPEDITAADQQIGFEIDTRELDPVPQIKRACEAFLPALAKSQEILQAFQKKTAQDLVAIAAGRAKYCEQLYEAAVAAREPDRADYFAAELELAQASAADPAVLQAAAERELAVFIRTLEPASADPTAEGFQVDSADDRGLLGVPAIAALIGRGWEVA